MYNYNKNYYTVYHTNEDKTFIMCEMYRNDDIMSVEVVGFHYGEPNADSFDFIGKCKAVW